MDIISNCNSIVDVLQQNLKKSQNKTALIFIDENENETESLTYSVLDHRARAIASELIKRGATGERVLLLYEPGLEFVCAFFGCLYAGAIAVPVYPPDPGRLNKSLPRLSAIVKDCGAKLALTSSRLKWLIKVFGFLPLEGTKDLRNLTLIKTDRMTVSDKALSMETITQETVAFLQYTSGSTGDPKGVILTHKNLLENNLAMQQKYRSKPDSHAVFWVPFYHDMGLIGGIIQTLYSGASATFISPVTFLKNPLIWIKALSKYQATHTAVPNFALELTARKASPEELKGLSLENLEFLLLGGEPVRKESMDKFNNIFSTCGFRKEAFYPAYGLAEATVLVSGGEYFCLPVIKSVLNQTLKTGKPVFLKNGGAGDYREIVSCGTAPENGEIIIVEPEKRTRCTAGSIGEVWVNAPYVAAGYWNNPELTREIFQATLLNEQKPYLRTGDLGFVDQSGELFVTGRIKDLIIIRGRNYYPQDIELTVEQNVEKFPEIRQGCCAVFSIENTSYEQIIIFLELNKSKSNKSIIIDAIVESVAKNHNLTVYAVFLLEKGTLPKTSSGKVKRFACKDAFNEGFAGSSIKVIEKRINNASKQAEEIDYYLIQEERTEITISDQDNEKIIMETGNVGILEKISQTNPETGKGIVIDFLKAKIAEFIGLESHEAIDLTQPVNSLGLDSLSAVEFVNAIQEETGIVIPFDYLIQDVNISDIADKIIHELKAETSPSGLAQVEHYTILNGKKANNLFCFPGLPGYGIIFSDLAKYIDTHTIYAFDFVENENPVNFYISQITKIQEHEPFTLLGYSAGGNLVVEIAREMKNRGHNIADVILIDSSIKKKQDISQVDGHIDITSHYLYNLVRERISQHFLKDFSSLSEKWEIKLRDYLTYHNSLINSEVLDIPIHHVRAEYDFHLDRKSTDWSTVTTAKYYEYQGEGSHFEMLSSPDSLKSNAGIIKNILEKIK